LVTCLIRRCQFGCQQGRARHRRTTRTRVPAGARGVRQSVEVGPTTVEDVRRGSTAGTISCCTSRHSPPASASDLPSQSPSLTRQVDATGEAETPPRTRLPERPRMIPVGPRYGVGRTVTILSPYKTRSCWD